MSSGVFQSPDGNVVAVCQEIPEFDGPGYDLRLESPGETNIAQLYHIGDGDPCSELAWSPDGTVLAGLSAHVARIRFVDVASALRRPVRKRIQVPPPVNIGRIGNGVRAPLANNRLQPTAAGAILSRRG